MDNDCRVKIVYRNEKLETVCERDYSLSEYSAVLRLDLLKIIMDVEDLLYISTGGLPKEMWPSDVLAQFNKIRHKLLDKAGEIERLPKNMKLRQVTDDTVDVMVEDNGKETLTGWITKIFQWAKTDKEE